MTYGYVLKIECDVFIFVFEFLRLVIRLDHDDVGYIRPLLGLIQVRSAEWRVDW